MQPSLLGKMLYVNPLVILKHKLMYGSLCFHIFNILVLFLFFSGLEQLLGMYAGSAKLFVSKLSISGASVFCLWHVRLFG